MVSDPVASVEVLNETWPLELSGACARIVFPCWKVTWPVGVPVAGGTAATVAVKVTDCPGFEGLGVEVRAVDDAPAWMVCTREELPALKLESPLYCAVMKCSSAVSVELVKVALPFASSGTLEASVVVVVCSVELTTA